MSSETVRPMRTRDIDMNEVELGECINGKFVPIYYGSSENIVVQTPYLKCRECPLVSAPNFDNILLMNVRLEGREPRHGKEVYDFMDNLEIYIAEITSKFNNKFFTGNRIVFKSLIRDDPLDENRHFIRLPIEFIPNTSIFFDKNNDVFDHNNLNENYYVKLIIEISGLWINNDEFGFIASIKKVKAMQWEKNQKVVSYEFIESDGESEQVISDKEDKIYSVMSCLDTEKTIKGSKTNVKSEALTHMSEKNLITPIPPNNKHTSKKFMNSDNHDSQRSMDKDLRKPIQTGSFSDSDIDTDDFFSK